MAVLVAHGDLNFAELRKHLMHRLPPYARPLFLRIRDDIDVTGTFKHKKSDLVREGFDPKAMQDAIYFDDPRTAGLYAARPGAPRAHHFGRPTTLE